MKNLKGLTKDIRKTHNMLVGLANEVGAYAISDWLYDDKLTLQCSKNKLLSWLKHNHLEINSDYYGSPAYEDENIVLFYYSEGRHW